MKNDFEEQVRFELLDFPMKVWPELTDYADRIIVYYVGPNDNVWPVFDESPDQDFIDSVNKHVDGGKDILLLCNISEAIREPTIDKIHRTLSSLKISPSHVFMTTGSLNGVELYDHYCKKNNWNDRITILTVNSFLKVSKELPTIQIDYIPRIRHKNFLCFNRVERKHRIILIAKLMLENILDHGFCSFYGKDFNNEWVNNLRDEIPEQYHDILVANSSIFPMHLTGNASIRNNPIEVLEEDRYLFEESYYSVVTETLFFNTADILSYGIIPAIFFTEKTYKPIAMKHPFILVSMPNSLTWLKSMGFKTFSPFINESYDDEQDGDLRMQMIVDEIKRLDSFTDQEWMQWQFGIKEIVEHNFKVYNSITISSLSQSTLNLPK